MAREYKTAAKIVIVMTGAGLIAYLAMNHLMLGEVLQKFSERGPLVSFVYLAWIACGFVVFFALITTAGHATLSIFFALFFVSLAVNYSYIVLGKRLLSLDVMEWLPHEMGQLPHAWSEYPGEICIAVGKAAALLGVFLVIRVVLHRNELFRTAVLSRKRARAIAVASFVAFTAAGIVLQPPNSVAETNLVVFGLPTLFATTPDLRSVPVRPARAALADKIVLVVDESVTYEVYEKAIAKALARFPLRDFGEAASTANCSAPSNALLRWGLEKGHIGDPAYDPRTNPTIWGYAKAAGFRTVLVDGQSTGAMHNYLSPKEFTLIDEFIPADSGIEADHRIAAILDKRLAAPGREFIYVVKRGTHFPYEMNYPVGAIAPDAPRTVKYFAAVSFSTRGFFDHIRTDLRHSNALFIYTSDHGQDLNDRSTHCNPDPRPEEYSVPLVVMTGVPSLATFLAGNASMQNRASHLNIFPTILYALGYEKDWVEATYGPTLAGPPSPYITYVSLGWTVRSNKKKRHTVESTAFVQSAEFPRRNLQHATERVY